MIFMTVLALQLFILCLAGLPSVRGNVEKEIFVAPHEPQELFFTGANGGQSVELEALHIGLPILTPSSNCRAAEPCRSLRISLNTSFLDGGEKQWVLLDRLEPGRRYEVRICWAATSPTDFILNLYTPLRLFSNPSLITSLISYSSQLRSSSQTVDEVGNAVEVPRSLLYLEIQARTSYYTQDKSRMEKPDSVDVEIILDPYFMNAVPESLFPIGGMIILIALLAWWGSGRIYSSLGRIGTTDVTSIEVQEKKDS